MAWIIELDRKTMKSPQVSVCIDVYNYADFLPEAIESALSQSWPDFEVVVMDDCSTDTSYEVALGYAKKDSRVRALRNTSNLGMVANRNACMKAARGTYIKFIHADDYLCSPDALSRMVKIFKDHPALSLVASSTHYVNSKSEITGQSPPSFSDRRLFAGTSVITRCFLEFKNLIGGPSAVMFRRSQAARGFDERYFHAADLEMWFHLLEQGSFAYISEPLTAYRWHPRQQTEKDRMSVSHDDDHRALNETYLWKPYVHLRRRIKEHLEHELIRQKRRRCKKLGWHDQASETLKMYGTRRYLTLYPWSKYWRYMTKQSRLYYDRELPRALESTPVCARVHPPGINVAGFFKSQFGIGESSRAFCRAVSECGLPSAFLNIRSNDHRNHNEDTANYSHSNPYAVNLMTFSFDYARRFYRDQGRTYFAGKRNIALWYWELERFPSLFHTNFDYYDEIWTPTDFCRNAFLQVSPIPVHKITYPLYPVSPTTASRETFGLRKSSYVFLFNFDYFSTVERKNPLAVIHAFRKAFDPSEDACLVLKSINSRHDAGNRDMLKQAGQGLNIIFLDEHFNQPQMASLFSSADAYISLHRSEGLGLGMAQAMALGKPVIATGYSGNLEYMNRENSLLVDYQLVDIENNYGPSSHPQIYGRGNAWANPDIEHAAHYMRWLYDHQDDGFRIGKLGRLSVSATLNPDHTRDQIRARIRDDHSLN